MDPRSLLYASPPDLVLLKTATTLSLSLALSDEAHGVKFLNGARDTLRAHDKAATVARLAAAGLPVPETILVQPRTNGKVPPCSAGGSWIAKPIRGVHGYGVAAYPSFPRHSMPWRLSMMKAHTSLTTAPVFSSAGSAARRMT